MTNALFNDNRLKLGVFGLNVSNGCAATTAEGHLQPTWQNNLDIAVMADRAGIEALVPVARWKGFGGKTNFNGTCFETYTWAAGLAAASPIPSPVSAELSDRGRQCARKLARWPPRRRLPRRLWPLHPSSPEGASS